MDLRSGVKQVDLNVSLGFGNESQSVFNSVTHGVSKGLRDVRKINLSKMKFDKSPIFREIATKQLFTGFMRLDLAEPLQQGNFIVFKGDKRASGRDLVIEGIVRNFLGENKDNRVVFAGLSHVDASRFLNSVAEG